jgi:cell division protein FtsB
MVAVMILTFIFTTVLVRLSIQSSNKAKDAILAQSVHLKEQLETFRSNSTLLKQEIDRMKSESKKDMLDDNAKLKEEIEELKSDASKNDELSKKEKARLTQELDSINKQYNSSLLVNPEINQLKQELEEIKSVQIARQFSNQRLGNIFLTQRNFKYSCWQRICMG